MKKHYQVQGLNSKNKNHKKLHILKPGFFGDRAAVKKLEESVGERNGAIAIAAKKSIMLVKARALSSTTGKNEKAKKNEAGKTDKKQESFSEKQNFSSCIKNRPASHDLKFKKTFSSGIRELINDPLSQKISIAGLTLALSILFLHGPAEPGTWLLFWLSLVLTYLLALIASGQTFLPGQNY